MGKGYRARDFSLFPGQALCGLVADRANREPQQGQRSPAPLRKVDERTAFGHPAQENNRADARQPMPLNPAQWQYPPNPSLVN